MAPRINITLNRGNMDELIGKEVYATVERIENYGVYFIYKGIKILGLISDVAETEDNLYTLYTVGQVVKVKLLKFVPEHNTYKGTTKGMTIG